MNDGLISTTATTPVLCVMAVANERRDTKGYDARKRGRTHVFAVSRSVQLLFGVTPARYLQFVILSVKHVLLTELARFPPVNSTRDETELVGGV